MSEITSRNPLPRFFSLMFVQCFANSFQLPHNHRYTDQEHKRNSFAILPFFISWTRRSGFFHGNKRPGCLRNCSQIGRANGLLCIEVVWLVIVECWSATLQWPCRVAGHRQNWTTASQSIPDVLDGVWWPRWPCKNWDVFRLDAQTQLVEHQSGWLVSDHPGGEGAGCGACGYWAPALVDILAASQLFSHSNHATSVAPCGMRKVQIWKWAFIAGSRKQPRPNQAVWSATVRHACEVEGLSRRKPR